MRKFSIQAFTFLVLMICFSLGNSEILIGNSGQCTVICPNSGIDCVHQDANGSTTWSEKGENDAAVITGPCDELFEPTP